MRLDTLIQNIQRLKYIVFLCRGNNDCDTIDTCTGIEKQLVWDLQNLTSQKKGMLACIRSRVLCIQVGGIHVIIFYT